MTKKAATTEKGAGTSTKTQAGKRPRPQETSHRKKGEAEMADQTPQTPVEAQKEKKWTAGKVVLAVLAAIAALTLVSLGAFWLGRTTSTKPTWPIVSVSVPQRSTVVPVTPERIVVAATPTDTAMPTSTATPTPVPTPTAMPTEAPTAIQPPAAHPPTSRSEEPPLLLYEWEGGIPYSGTTINIDVAPGELCVVTGGPLSVAGVNLPGGIDRGSVLILLPAKDNVARYVVKNVIPGANWVGAYRITQPLTQEMLEALINDRVAAMKSWPNCTDGVGCSLVDVLVVGPDGLITQEVK